MRSLLILMFCVTLSACGFRLAGTADLPEQLSQLHLVTNGFDDSQRRALQRSLTRAGAELVEQADAPAVKLSVNLKKLPDRQMATSASTGASVRRITRKLDFNLKSADGKTLQPMRSLSQQKDVTLDDDNLLSSDREKETVIRELEQDLFDQLIRQLTLN
jgi:LPS-assembly lipoprotein